VPLSNCPDILVFTGPEYAEMCLGRDESFYEAISLAQVLRLLERKESLWGHNHGAAQLHWCFIPGYSALYLIDIENCHTRHSNTAALDNPC
jgi:hypothetical protein